MKRRVFSIKGRVPYTKQIGPAERLTKKRAEIVGLFEASKNWGAKKDTLLAAALFRFSRANKIPINFIVDNFLQRETDAPVLRAIVELAVETYTPGSKKPSPKRKK